MREGKWEEEWTARVGRKVWMQKAEEGGRVDGLGIVLSLPLS